MFGFGGGNYLWAIIILILIVLQWFRVGYGGMGGGIAGGPGTTEPGLMGNGGLFIIAIFVLIVCGCFARGGFGGMGGGYGGGYGGFGY